MKTDKEIEAMADQYTENTELNFPDEIAEAYKEGYKSCQRDAEEKPKCFEEFWSNRNSYKVPYNHPLRKEEDRALMVWIHGMSAGAKISSEEIQSLKSQLSEKDAEIEHLKRQYADEVSGKCDDTIAKHLRWEVSALKSREQRLVETLRFYAKCDNWETSVTDDFCTVKTKMGKDKESFGVATEYSFSKLHYFGGKRARETLKELEIL